MGYGSGNWRTKHLTTSDFPSLDIRSLQRKGFLSPGRTHICEPISTEYTETTNIQTEDDQMTIHFCVQSGATLVKHASYKFMIDWMACNLGGKRAFFLCPRCRRRVCLIYFVNQWGCRHCHNLTYACQGENAQDRYARQADKIRVKLGWKKGILNPVGGIPKGMHAETFAMLIDKEAWYTSKVLNSLPQALKKKFSTEI